MVQDVCEGPGAALAGRYARNGYIRLRISQIGIAIELQPTLCSASFSADGSGDTPNDYRVFKVGVETAVLCMFRSHHPPKSTLSCLQFDLPEHTSNLNLNRDVVDPVYRGRYLEL